MVRVSTAGREGKREAKREEAGCVKSFNRGYHMMDISWMDGWM